MIGVTYKLNGELKYRCFKAKKYSNKQEKKILYKFKTFIDEIKSEVDPDNCYPIRFFHWSHCEQTLLSTALMKHQSLSNLFSTNISWIDLCDIFMKEPIVINGAVNFKLKDVAKAMRSHGMITTEWPQSSIMDGLNAMIMAGKYYVKKRNQQLTENDKLIFKDIIKYNEIDCKVLAEIVDYFRKN
jgi:predicted RecB family nuclease